MVRLTKRKVAGQYKSHLVMQCVLCCKQKNLKLVEKKQLKNDSNDSINVVEIQSNRGGFVGPLGNKLKNVKFSKSQLWKHMKKKKLKEYKSPFAKLLGYDLSILVDPNTSDHQNNA
eukprot:899892_1